MKIDVKVDFPDDFEKIITDAAVESIKENGIDITCPNCNAKFHGKGTSFNCPKCSTHFSLEQ